jgi:hypothetical protein
MRNTLKNLDLNTSKNSASGVLKVISFSLSKFCVSKSHLMYQKQIPSEMSVSECSYVYLFPR